MAKKRLSKTEKLRASVAACADARKGERNPNSEAQRRFNAWSWALRGLLVAELGAIGMESISDWEHDEFCPWSDGLFWFEYMQVLEPFGGPTPGKFGREPIRVQVRLGFDARADLDEELARLRTAIEAYRDLTRKMMS